MSQGSPTFAVLIATSRRAELLQRTLQSLAKCEVPPTLTEVVVVENGESRVAEPILREALDGFAAPPRYLYSEPGNKSVALNKALETITADWVVFFDDDIRLEPDVLTYYAEAINALREPAFFGGRTGVDYEAPPPDWLKKYLPASSRGLDLGQTGTRFSEPKFLGFNWAARTAALRLSGGFNPDFGPGGRLARGQETDMMTRLLEGGDAAVFLREPLVHHYVPAASSSMEFALARMKSRGIYEARHLLPQSSFLERAARVAGAWVLLAGLVITAHGLRTLCVPLRLRFRFDMAAAYYSGFLVAPRRA